MRLMSNLMRKSLATFIFIVVAMMLVQVCYAVPEKQTVADEVLSFIEDVARIDVSRYSVTLSGHNIYYPSSHGGLPKELVKYTLDSNESELPVIADFVNGTFSSCNFYYDKGSPIYVQTQASVLNEAKGMFERIQLLSGIPYPEEMRNMMNSLTPSTTNTTLTSTNLKLTSSLQANNISIEFFYTEDGIDYQRKNVVINFENGNLVNFISDWNLYKVGDTSPNISREEALNTALEVAENYNLVITVGNSTVEPEFTINTERTEIELTPVEREPLTLQLRWNTRMYFEEMVYATYAIDVHQWADTGKINYVTSISYGGAIPPAVPRPTAEPTDSTPTVESTESPPTTELEIPTNTALIMITAGIILTTATIAAATAMILRKRRNK